MPQTAKANREKGLSAAGTKAALAGNEKTKPETCSLYKEEFGTYSPKSADTLARLQRQQAAVSTHHEFFAFHDLFD